MKIQTFTQIRAEFAEPLRHDLQGYWSRRINDEHRLVCRIAGDTVIVAACRYHYGKG